MRMAGARVQGPGSRVQGPGSRVQGSGSRVQGSGSRETFTAIELEILRLEAERERAEIKKAGVYMPFSLGEKMLEFAEEMNRGNTWNTPGAQRFAGMIKRHLKSRGQGPGSRVQVKTGSAGSVKIGTSPRGAVSKKRS
jgi:hypothetical protein